MYSLSEELKKKCLRIGEGVYTNYKLYFPELNLTIDNETIHQESAAIKSAISDGAELEFGGCIATEFDFEVSEIITTDLKNQKFKASIVLMEDDEEIEEIPMGEFIVDTVQMVNDKDYKKIVAFDMFKVANETDVSGWYKSIFPIIDTEIIVDEDGTETEKVTYGSVQLHEFKSKLLEYLGISYKAQIMPNDTMNVEKTIEPEEGRLTGQTLLKMICTLQGGFGIIGRDGRFRIIHLTGIKDTITICPDNFETPEIPEYKEMKFEEYECEPITCLKLSTDNNDVGKVIGDNLSNPYVISGNYLIYGKSDSELEAIGNTIYTCFLIGYRPLNVKLKSTIYADIGDKILIERENGDIESFILSRELAGIQSLNDNFIATGTQKRENKVTANQLIEQLKGRILNIQATVDGVYMELSDLEKNTVSLISQLAEEIVLKVDSNGNLVEVGLGVDADDGKTYFLVKAENISLTADEAIDLISGGDLNLTGKNITISSDNFNVTEKGEVTIKDGYIYITNGDSYISINPNENNIIEVGVNTTGEIVDDINKLNNCFSTDEFPSGTYSLLKYNDKIYTTRSYSGNRYVCEYVYDEESDKFIENTDIKIIDFFSKYTISYEIDSNTFVIYYYTSSLSGYYIAKFENGIENEPVIIKGVTTDSYIRIVGSDKEYLYYITSKYIDNSQPWLRNCLVLNRIRIENESEGIENIELEEYTAYGISDATYESCTIQNECVYIVVSDMNRLGKILYASFVDMDFKELCDLPKEEGYYGYTQECLVILQENYMHLIGNHTYGSSGNGRMHYIYDIKNENLNIFNDLPVDIGNIYVSNSCFLIEDKIHLFSADYEGYTAKQGMLHYTIETSYEGGGEQKTFYITRNGEGFFNGDIIAKSLTLGTDVNIPKENLEGYEDLATKEDIKDMANIEDLLTTEEIKDIIYGEGVSFLGDVTQTQEEIADGIIKTTTKIKNKDGTTTENSVYSAVSGGKYILTDVGVGDYKDPANYYEEDSYFAVSTDGLLTAVNAVINGTVYATDGRFSGTIYASKGSIASYTITDRNLESYGTIMHEDAFDENYRSGMQSLNYENPDFAIAAFYAGCSSLPGEKVIGNSNWYVRHDGRMYCGGGIMLGTAAVSIEDEGEIIKYGESLNTIYFGEKSTEGFDHIHTTALRGDEVRIYDHAYGVYLGASGSVAVTSDENVKDIYEIDERYEEFFMKLKPVLYKYKNGGHRKHVGLGARQVKKALDESEIDAEEFAGIILQKNVTISEDESLDRIERHYDELYSLRYEEINNLTIDIVQKQQKKIQELENTVKELIKKINYMEKRLNQ